MVSLAIHTSIFDPTDCWGILNYNRNLIYLDLTAREETYQSHSVLLTTTVYLFRPLSSELSAAYAGQSSHAPVLRIPAVGLKYARPGNRVYTRRPSVEVMDQFWPDASKM